MSKNGRNSPWWAPGGSRQLPFCSQVRPLIGELRCNTLGSQWGRACEYRGCLFAELREEEDGFLFPKLGRIFHESRNAVTGDAAEGHFFKITLLSSFSVCLQHSVKRRCCIDGGAGAAPRSSAGGTRRGQPVRQGELVLVMAMGVH